MYNLYPRDLHLNYKGDFPQLNFDEVPKLNKSLLKRLTLSQINEDQEFKFNSLCTTLEFLKVISDNAMKNILNIRLSNFKYLSEIQIQADQDVIDFLKLAKT